MIRSTLEEVENLKNDAIREIQTELKKIREAHSNMVKTYEGKLSEFGIPVEELGFDPLVPANIWELLLVFVGYKIDKHLSFHLNELVIKLSSFLHFNLIESFF